MTQINFAEEINTSGKAALYLFGTKAEGWNLVLSDSGESILNFTDKQEAINTAEIIETSRRYAGAFLRAEAAFQENKEKFRNVSKHGGKSVRETYLMQRFNIDQLKAREITNIETSQNIPADTSETVGIEEFIGELWADNALQKMNNENHENDFDNQVSSEMSNKELAVLFLTNKYKSAFRPRAAQDLGLSEPVYVEIKDRLNADEVYLKRGTLTEKGKEAVRRFVSVNTPAIAESRIKAILTQGVFNASQDSESAAPWMLEPQEIQKLTEEEFVKTYNDLEEQNFHSENLVLFAKRKGNALHMREAQNILDQHEDQGELTFELKQRRIALYSKLMEARQDDFMTIKTVYGDTVRVLRRDYEGQKKNILGTYNKNGERIPEKAIHRDNLDIDGSKHKANAEENKNNPLFDILTTKEGNAFKTQAAAQREINRQGFQDSHQVIPASEVSSGTEGYVAKKKDNSLDGSETKPYVLSIGEEKALQEADCSGQGPKDFTESGGYRAILANSGKKKNLQDLLDSIFQGRLFQVRNALKDMGWEGEAGKSTFTKDGMTIKHGYEKIGAGQNVVSVEHALSGGNLTEPLRFIDFLEEGRIDFAKRIDDIANLHKLKQAETEGIHFPPVSPEFFEALESMSVRIVNPELELPFFQKTKDMIVMCATRPILGTEYEETTKFTGGSFYVAIDPQNEFAIQNINENRKLDARIIMPVNKDCLIDAYKVAMPRYADKVEAMRNTPEKREMVIDMAKDKLTDFTFIQACEYFSLKPTVQIQPEKSADIEQLQAELASLENLQVFYAEAGMKEELSGLRDKIIPLKQKITLAEQQTVHLKAQEPHACDETSLSMGM